MRHIYREEIGEIKWRNARMSCAYALMAMRTKAGISRKMMACGSWIFFSVYFRPSKWQTTKRSICLPS